MNSFRPLNFLIKVLSFDLNARLLKPETVKYKRLAKFVYISTFVLLVAIAYSGRASANGASSAIKSSLQGMTIGKMQRFSTGFQTTLPAQAQSRLGGITEIKCAKGQAPASCLPIGVLDTTFAASQMTPAQIAAKRGAPLTGRESLAATTPYLGKISVRQALTADPSLARLVPQQSLGRGGMGIDARILNQPFGAVVDLNRVQIGQTRLANTALHRIPGYQKLMATEIPGLSSISLLDMPGMKIPAGAAIVQIDAVRTNEKNIHHMVMSGSEPEPNAKCKDKCDYIEVLPVLGLPYLRGGRIISGDSLQVRGGKGLLAFVNGGREPTGVHFMGGKLVLRNLDAKRGTARVNFNLKFCYNFFGEHCTPYFVGIPLWEIGEKHKSFPIITTDASVYRVFKPR
jgi:hypothetical protein